MVKKFLRSRKNIYIISTFIMVLLLSITKKIYIFEYKYLDNTNKKINCMIIEKKKQDQDKISYLVKYDNNNFILNIYNFNKEDENLEYGNVVKLNGKISKIEKLNNPYDFDYKKYLNSNNIVSTISTYNSVKLISKRYGNIFLRFSYFIIDCINSKIDNCLSTIQAGMYKSMLYGNIECLDSEVYEKFKEDGIIHILAVSGMHLTYLLLILNTVLKENHKIYVKIIYYLVIFFYLSLSGFSLSAIRAAIMSILIISGVSKNKYFNLFLSYIFMLIYNPYIIFNSSAIFSYLATLGILMFDSLIYSYFTKIIVIPNYLKGIFKIISTTFSSMILIIPIQIYYYGYIQLKSIFTAVCTSYLTSIIYLLTFISFFLTFVPIISNILFNSLNLLLYIYFFLLDIISRFPTCLINIPKPYLFEIYLYYISIFSIMYSKYLVLIMNRNLINIARKSIKIFCIFSFFVIFSFAIYRIYFEEYVVYFNVGQGNMAIIKKNRKVILVDVGSTNEKLASNTLNNFLKAKAIKEIDLVLLTHMHEDHMNGIYNIDAKIKRIGYSIPSEITEEYLKLEEYIRQNNISKLELKKGDEINFKNINIQILLPFNNKNIKADDIINANSMVILIKITENKKLVKEYSRNFLFMGDSTNETEKVLLKEYDIDIFKNIDILQIGHHGSKTSSSEEFIRIINTKLTLISCKKEVYGHPAKETLDKLEKYNIRYHITQNSGALKINI